MKERYDENEQLIGDGTSHSTYHVEDMAGYPVHVSVQESATTESVYVFYTNLETLEVVKVRFSTHICNGIKFGMYVDGYSSDARNEILYRLGFMAKEFIPRYVNSIRHQAVAKKKLHLYEEADKTFEELLALPAGTDISEYKGKLVKGTTEVITSDKVISEQCGGHYIYKTK